MIPTSLQIHCTITAKPSFFFTATATTEIYTLSLHDALPIFLRAQCSGRAVDVGSGVETAPAAPRRDHRPTDLRHWVAAHRNHGATPPDDGRPATPGPRAVARGVPAAAPAARKLVGEPGIPGARCQVHEGARGESRLHRAAFHDRR